MVLLLLLLLRVAQGVLGSEIHELDTLNSGTASIAK